MTFIVGVVVEGKDDFEVIEAAAIAELAKTGIGDVAFRRLQPETDETGATERGGWTKVVGWLIDHAGEGLETFFAPLFSNAPGCDAILVHIDGDIYQDCLKKAGANALIEPASVADIVTALRAAIDDWLNVSAERRKSLAYAVPVFKTENWLMASVKDCPEETWPSADAKKALKSLFDSKKYKSVAFMKTEFINEFRKDSQFVMKRAKSYKAFARDIGALGAA